MSTSPATDDRGPRAYCPRCEGPTATTDVPCLHHVQRLREDLIDDRPDLEDLA